MLSNQASVGIIEYLHFLNSTFLEYFIFTVFISIWLPDIGGGVCVYIKNE